MKINLSQLTEALNAEKLSGNLATDADGAVIDSRKIHGGELFFALQGENTDGHNFVAQAAKSGAGAAIVERELQGLPEGFSVLKVKDAKAALCQAGTLARNNFGGKVIGITGSNGKTTTKDMIAEVLAQSFKTTKTFANFNNEIGLPLTILNCPEESETLVLEMGMRARGEIALLADIARPDIGVITNIGISHMEILKTQENIAYAKFELIDALPSNGTAILNADDEWCCKLASKNSCNNVFYGFGDNADMRCIEMNINSSGTNFKINYQNNIYDAFLPTWGRHNISNALAAFAVGLSVGMMPVDIIQGLRNYQPSPMRLEVKKGQTGFCILDDAYNANPLSVAASLEVLSAITLQRTIAVLGEMYELGELEEEGHYNVGQKVVENKIDILVTVGQKAEKIAEGAAKAGMNPKHIHAFMNNETASKFLMTLLKPEDTVLVKGSRGMHMEHIIAKLI